MAKEVVAGETVGAIDDDGPEEGEIEDDTSEEDGAEKNFCSSNSTDVNTSVGVKYYQPSSSSKSESHIVKSKIYSEDKKRLWRNSKRRIYNLYVDHDKPSRDSYNRLTKSDLNSDHREINFHDLLRDYRTSKHGNEGNSHEKENRHYSKEVRTDSSRKRESGMSESQEDKLKRSRKRKQHRSPSRDRHTSVSSDTDGVRKRKDVRNTRQKRNRKIPPRIRNLRESAALFAKIRASKLNAASASEQQKTQVGEVQNYNENATKVSEVCSSNVRHVVSESAEGKCDEPGEGNIEGQGLQKEPFKNESGKSLCSASDSQTAEKNDDSESKDEEDDVNQLRMIALQSAFRAKYLERKRRGIVRKQARKTSYHIPPKENSADSEFNLDDTADLLEAAVEEAVSSSASKETQPSSIENWQCTLFSSLSEVPLPPDDPPIPTPVEDLTPVDMDLALTDEEENTHPCQNVGNGLQSENFELYNPRVRTNRCLPKARSIPVTIGGRTQSSKTRKRTANSTENTRSNLLEVMTCTSEGQVVEDLDSSFVSMSDVNMDSMILLDAVGTCSSPEAGPRLEEDQTISEASDSKSDLVQYSANQASILGNNLDDEDEELLRERLLDELSRRHRGENMASNTMDVEEMKGSDPSIVHPSLHETVTAHVATEELEPTMRPIGESVTSHAANLELGRVKVPLKRSVERTRRGQLLAKVRNRQVSIASNAQMTASPYRKSYLSKVASRGKYQRVNQNRIMAGKKRIDGNLHVTVVGSGNKAQSVSAVPQQQDRIVICLGEDSDESDEERQNALSKRFPLGNNLHMPPEKPLDNSVEPSELLTCNATGSSQQPVLESQFPVANVPTDFEKSVDRFLKEVRSVQESRLQDQLPSQDLQSKRENIVQKQSDITGSKVNSKANVTPLVTTMKSKTNEKSAVPNVNLKGNVTSGIPKVAGNAAKAKPAKQIVKAVSGVTPQAVRHLPPPQQEEYRRLKIQISVLEELRKKRKAAEVAHVSSRNEGVIPGKVFGSAVLSVTPKLPGQLGPLQESSSGGESADKGAAGRSLDLKKDTRSLASETSCNVSTSGDDIEDEDVNLMREQLLRSRLHKKMNAMAEMSVMKSEDSPATVDTILLGPSAVLNAIDVPPKLCRQENTLTSEEPSIKSASASTDGHLQRKVTTPSKGIITSSDTILETASCSTSDMQERTIPLDVDSSKGITIAVVKCGKVESCAAKGDDALPSVGKADVNIGECSSVVENIPLRKSETPASGAKVPEEVSTLAVSHSDGGDKVAKVGATVDQAEGISEVETAATLASLVPSRSTPLVPGTGVPAFQFTLESNDTRSSELAELEFQLLSERHAALQYLSELSSLLTKMEIEGAHLRQKEIAAQKLRAELNSAESAIAVKKDFLKQLALTISSTRERVTSTRQRCSMLCHACTRLGNQIKQDKRANGGKSGSYQVPTGGAALVKSRLSSVLWQTKQLKKAGLPFLRGQNFVSSSKCPTMKRSRQIVTGVVPWSNLTTNSLETLKTSSSNKSGPQPMAPHLGSSATLDSSVVSAPLINNSFVLNAVLKPKTPSNPSTNLSDVARKVSPVKKPILSPGKFIFTPSLNVGASTSVASSESVQVKGHSLVERRPTSETSTMVSVATTSTSQSTKSGVSRAATRDTAANEVVLLGPGEQTASLPSVARKGVQLRDYRSPLEPMTNRTNAENLATLSGSLLQPEESVMLDPNVILCPYDLMGECQDEECSYQHQRRRKGAMKGS